MPRRVSGPEADRHEQVAEGGVLGAPDGVHAGEHRGLRGVGEIEAEKRMERLNPDEARAYLADPNSIDALAEELRSA